MRSTRITLLVAAVVFARALIPAGYMPGSAESGLLFVLCPEGVPAGFSQFLSGSDLDDTHAHHAVAGQDDHHCPIGHMLTSVAAADDVWAPSPEASNSVPAVAFVHSFVSVNRSTYRSRGPPA